MSVVTTVASSATPVTFATANTMASPFFGPSTTSAQGDASTDHEIPSTGTGVPAGATFANTPALAAAAAASPTLHSLTGRQRVLRRQITLTKQSLTGLFSNPLRQPSRRAVNSFKAKLEQHLKEAEGTHDLIVQELTGHEFAAAFDEQTQRHYYYLKEDDDALEVADDYLERRKDEADSIASQRSRKGDF